MDLAGSQSSLSIRLRAPASSINKYLAKQHAQRVAEKLGDPDGLIYLLGQYDFTIEDSDQAKTWKQRRYFYYCSGVDVPNCCLLYNIRDDDLVLYIPEIDPARVLWTGRGPTIKEAEALYDVDAVRLNGQLFDDLEDWKKNYPAAPFYILHPDHRPVGTDFQHVDSEKLQDAIDSCRVVKDDYEINKIREANKVSAMAHDAVLRNIKRFQNESQINGLFIYVCVSKFSKLAYPVIAGSGPNASELHYMKNDEPLAGRQFVCLDAGAEVGLYAADVTRTFPLSGSWPSQEGKAVYDIVQEMQETCIANLRPGIKMITLHVLAHTIAIKGLLKLGILHNGTNSEIYAAGTSKGFFPHGLGHHLGLEVHDVNGKPVMKYRMEECPVLDSANNFVPFALDQPDLEPGMVVTVEPGIYFNRYELNRAYLDDPIHAKYINREVLDQYWDVGGVRIEDDILITADGFEILTTAPKGEAALEIIRQGNSHGL